MSTVPTDIELDPEPSNPDRRAGKGGRRPARHVPELALDLFRPRVSSVPPEGDVSLGLLDWYMLGNDTLGDCGPAMTEHARMAKGLLALAKVKGTPSAYVPGFRRPTTQMTTGLYYAYGEAQGEGPDADEGVDNATWLAFLFADTQAKIAAGQDDIEEFAYAELDVTSPGWVDQWHADMLSFHGVLTGVNLTDDAIQLFEAHQPWTVANGEQPDPQLGHDILVVSYNADMDNWVTWGTTQASTRAWTEACVDEAWVIVTKEDAERAGLAYPALLAACKAIGGGQIAAPVDPVPAPAVAPQPEGLIERLEKDAEKLAEDAEKVADKAGEVAEDEARRLAAEAEAEAKKFTAAAEAEHLVTEVEADVHHVLPDFATGAAAPHDEKGRPLGVPWGE
jgi:hypothetical protein